MEIDLTLLLVLDLVGVFAFALNGALTAIRVARIDIIGVLTLGMVTALGGGIVRDIMIGDVPPATFSDWRYLVVAATGALVAFALGARLTRLTMPIPSWTRPDSASSRSPARARRSSSGWARRRP